MGNTQTVRKVNFEDIQLVINNPNLYIIITTLSDKDVQCLIKGTIDVEKEELTINNLINSNKNKKIIIYGKNCNDETIYKKYKQLITLGFTNVFIYVGGMFEWLMLQDIYGYDEFPTHKKIIDILYYKPLSQLNLHLLENG